MIDAPGRYAYVTGFDDLGPAVAIVDLATFEQVGTIALDQDDLASWGWFAAAVIDPAGNFAYLAFAFLTTRPGCQDRLANLPSCGRSHARLWPNAGVR
ncbi:MAG TPA: hypothetical protein VMZ51_02560 [Acidimicrobiales bacterium]|nr:hypothetical protein [Acidimicrobiales bacterium]